MKIKMKMLLVFGCSVFLILSGLSLGIYILIEKKVISGLDNEISNMIHAAQKNIGALEDIAIKNYLRAITEKDKDVISHFYAQFKNSEIDVETLKKRASEVILYKKIGETGYVAGVSSKGILSIHPKAEGVDISKTSFWPKVDALLHMPTRSGYIEYDWKNPNEEKARKKAAYLTYFEPMDLIIWASSYKSEFASLVKSEDLREAILSMKVGKNGYPFVFDWEGNMIIHPSLEGKNVSNIKSEDGQYIVQTMIKEKNGKLEYDWKDPDGSVNKKIVLFREMPGKHLIVAIGAYKKEQYALLYSMRNGLLIAFGVSMGIVAAVVFLFSNILTKPIIKGVEFSEQMSEGDFTKTLDINQKDEIGQLAKALNRMTKNIGDIFRQLRGSIDNLSVSSEELAGISQKMSTDSKQMTTNSNSLSQVASKMESNLDSVSNASERVMENISSVASATEQMSGTVNEIAVNSEKARSISGQAVTFTKEASDLVDALGKAAFKINDVTETIDEISEQTNLLALNATIEAARAGEAGKGFAVVASEIKALAGQTSDATKQIQSQIDEVQLSTHKTVEKIKDISRIIFDVNDIVSGIAASVEEQSATTGEIAESMGKTSLEMQEVNENVSKSAVFSKQIAEQIAGVHQVASEMDGTSATIDNNASSFRRLARDIQNMLAKFQV